MHTYIHAYIHAAVLTLPKTDIWASVLLFYILIIEETFSM